MQHSYIVYFEKTGSDLPQILVEFEQSASKPDLILLWIRIRQKNKNIIVHLKKNNYQLGLDL